MLTYVRLSHFAFADSSSSRPSRPHAAAPSASLRPTRARPQPTPRSTSTRRPTPLPALHPPRLGSAFRPRPRAPARASNSGSIHETAARVALPARPVPSAPMGRARSSVLVEPSRAVRPASSSRAIRQTAAPAATGATSPAPASTAPVFRSSSTAARPGTVGALATKRTAGMTPASTVEKTAAQTPAAMPAPAPVTARFCDGGCVDVSIGFANCGSCGHSCAAGDVCTLGVCATAEGAWQMFGSDPQHTGNNPTETGKPPSDRVVVRAAVERGALPAVVEDGRAFTSYGGEFGATAPVVVVSVSDGSPIWTYNFGAVDSVGHPAVVDGAVYLETNHGTEGSSELWSINATLGTVTWSAPFGSQWESFWAPIVVDGNVYMDGGEYGGLYAFNASTGGQVFFDDSVGQYDSWSPAFFGGAVYTFVAGAFVAHDPLTGNAIWSGSTVWNWTGYSMNTAPVFGPSLGYVISPPNVVAFDPVKQAVAWTANATYSGTPAVAGGIVFAISNGILNALDETSGSILWTFAGDTSLLFPPVTANGYAYVSSTANVYAVDFTTHASVWSAPVGGWLSIASGRLLVAGAGTLYGFVLTPL